MNVDFLKSLAGDGYRPNGVINISDIDCGYNVGDKVEAVEQVPKTLSQNIRYPFQDEVRIG